MPQSLSVLMAQINPTVGAIAANAEKMIHIIESHQHQHDLIIFPELSLTGYPPEDLLFRKEFFDQIDDELKKFKPVFMNAMSLLVIPVLNKINVTMQQALSRMGTKWHAITNSTCPTMVFLMNNVTLVKAHRNPAYSPLKIIG